jgi:hypothetical protein
MADQNMVAYIRDSLSQGHSLDSIRQALLSQGWDEVQINEAFAEAQAAPGTQAIQAQTPQQTTTGKRPTEVTVICILGFLISVFFILTGIVTLFLGSLSASLGTGTLTLEEGASSDVSDLSGLGSLLIIFSGVPLLVGIIGFGAFYLLLKTNKIGWILVLILGIISMALGILQAAMGVFQFNIISLVFWGLIVAYLFLKRNLFA